MMDCQKVLSEQRMNEIKKKALACIAQYGTLRWCDSVVCACMGCVNTKMSRVEYELALQIPEVKEANNKPTLSTNERYMMLTRVVKPTRFIE